MDRNYDETIASHYREVAERHGLEASSTMADETVRNKESDAIVRFVAAALRRRRALMPGAGPATILDLGCGNGYTLGLLAARFPAERLVGVEHSPELLALARRRLEGNAGVELLRGDARDPGFFGERKADVLVCQRVLINLLDERDQRLALDNAIHAVRAPGALLFLECFNEPLARLNEARAEFDLEPIAPAHHNRYLPGDFFQRPELAEFRAEEALPPPNFLSTHYYVTRVFHAAMTRERPFKRNSEFVRFFSGALQEAVGDYAPLKLFVFERVCPSLSAPAGSAEE